jgi:hypothetical protein
MNENAMELVNMRDGTVGRLVEELGKVDRKGELMTVVDLR